MGINSVGDAADKELDMQLRKLATAMLVMGMTAGLAQAEDAAPAAGQSTLDKIAKMALSLSAIANLPSLSLTTITNRRLLLSGLLQRHRRCHQEKLNKPDLQVKLIPVTSQNRIPLLQNGTFDFECGSTTNNLERQKQAAFSDTIFVVGTRLLVKKGGPIKDFPDLKDKAVVVTSGTTSEILLHKLNDEKK
jgi:glutamate/aspartate transport system substrate-binding protein